MTDKKDLHVVLDELDLTITDNTQEYKVHIYSDNNDYIIQEYKDNTLQVQYTVSNKGKVYGDAEEFQNNPILVRAYNILFNYYLITNVIRDTSVIKNSRDLFVIKSIN